MQRKLSQKLISARKMTCFSSNIFFGQFLTAFAQKQRPYGRQFFPATEFFLGPVLSYFAEFSAGWQQCKNYVLNKTGQTVTQT
jgi:hypothetical protein